MGITDDLILIMSNDESVAKLPSLLVFDGIWSSILIAGSSVNKFQLTYFLCVSRRLVWFLDDCHDRVCKTYHFSRGFITAAHNFKSFLFQVGFKKDQATLASLAE